MQIVRAEMLKNRRVILRLDLDVKIENGLVVDDFRLKQAIPTIKLCLENAQSIRVIGHIGRPAGKVVGSLSVQPIIKWFQQHHLQSDNLIIEENLRFNSQEEQCDLAFAKQLARNTDLYINEAFAAHHPAASTTVLPTLLPHAAGLRFAKEVEVLTNVRKNPKRPFVAIIGGIKLEDKLPAVLQLSKIAEAVLVGGLLAQNIKDQKVEIPMNVMLGKLADNGLDMADETVESFIKLIKNAKQIVWAGPLGKYEVAEGNLGNKKLAEAILQTKAEIVIGGGDTLAAISKLGILEQFDKLAFVSVGGGAMLKFLSEGTLPTIKALE